MRDEEFHKILDQYFDWFMGTTEQLPKKPLRNYVHKKRYDKDAPEQGYPVVRSLKTPGGPCSWCGEYSEAPRYYSRQDLTTNTWSARCRDKHCQKKLTVKTHEIGKERTFIVCPIRKKSK